MELNELKNQINPHFLFNMLNGIKALVRTDPEKATLVIMKFSEFLRYQIYEYNEEKTLLRSEITFLSNFLSLEMLRRDHLSVEINAPEPLGILNGIYIPPNIFTTFVENAVKHSVSISDSDSYIRLKIAVIEDQLHFLCVNSKDPDYISSDLKNSGFRVALNFLSSNVVDLIFLDIEMPMVSGIEFATQLPDSILVIFTTAYPQYALKSYELDAIDYSILSCRRYNFARY